MSATPSEYLKYLPQIFLGTDPSGPVFLDGYLKVFEALLSGRDDAAVASLEGTIATFPDRLDPGLTPIDGDTATPLHSAFLDYLAGWVALSFDQNWELDKRREWLKRIVPLYKRRGTRAGLSEYLAMFVGHQAKVEELPG